MATINLPALQGSEKQIAWAEKIRKEMLTAVAWKGRTNQQLAEQVASMPEDKQAQVFALLAKDENHPIAKAWAMAHETSAAWFIENRPHGSFSAGGKKVMAW